MQSRGQRRFPGIVITTFKRRRVNLVEWSPLCPLSIRPSFIRFMFYDECTPRLMFMGNAVWPLSAFNPFRSLFSPLFLFLLILSNPSKRISILDILYPSYFSPPLFFFLHLQLLPATPEGIIVNGGRGQLFSGFSDLEKKKNWKVGGKIENHLTHFSASLINHS